jgi:secreted trypsin-like serine protease
MAKRSNDDPLVAASLAYAERHARDDAHFVRLLNEYYRDHDTAAERSGSGRRLRVLPARDRDPLLEIMKDPRYLANARALARRTHGPTRIIGGTEVKEGEFLDCVAVGSSTKWACTGTLIAPDVVVTAGHCAEVATRVFVGGDVAEARAADVVKVKKRVRHPQYHRRRTNDLMVLLLSKRIIRARPREIAPARLIERATDGRAVGFGHTDPWGIAGYGVKRQVDVPMASTSCSGEVRRRDDAATYGCDEGVEIVAGRPLLDRDSCKGDSGGPLYVLKGRQWLLAGATSRATKSVMHTCGDGGIYVRVDKYLDWIRSIPGVSLP